LDDPSPGVKAAVKGIDEFGGALNMLDPVAPFIGALTPALSLAGAVSKRALDSYAQPDKVISIDMDFLLADKERVRSKTASPGEYLRYGYYFFLSEPVEGKLWASVRTPKNVQLMLRQHSRKVGELEYFPLTEVSYLVVRVTEPTDSGNRNKIMTPKLFKTLSNNSVKTSVSFIATTIRTTTPSMLPPPPARPLPPSRQPPQRKSCDGWAVVFIYNVYT